MNAQLKLFARKTYLLKKRNIFRNLFLCLVPILFVCVVKVSNPQRPSESNEISESEINQDDLADYFPGELGNKVYYAPQTGLTENLMEAVRLKLYIVDERIVPLGSDTELEFALLDNPYICFAVHFLNTSSNNLQYVIRTKNNNFRTEAIYSRDVFTSYRKRDNEYVESGFLSLQNAIDVSFVNLIKQDRGASELRNPHHITYGHIPVDSKRGPQGPTQIFNVFVGLCFGFTTMSTYLVLLPMVEERANGMKEYLKIATPSSYLNEGAQIAINFLQFYTVLALCLAISVANGVWDTNPAQIIYLLLFGLLFVVNLIVFTLLLSTMLESATIATAVAPLAFFGPLILSELWVELSILCCLFPSNQLIYMGRVFDVFKASGHQFTAGDLFTIGYPGLDSFNLFGLLLLQVLGLAMWTFLWYYVSNVFPGRYGTPKTKFFFLRGTLSEALSKNGFKSGSRSTNKINAESQHGAELQQFPSSSSKLGKSNTQEPLNNSETANEPSSSTSTPLLRITNLYKVFTGRTGGVKEVVKNFSLTIYSHSITVLLGHNGAGKTTTMNIVTGILPPTSGMIVLDGERDANRYRQNIGFCPQHNVFFSHLTCREHVEFFGCLRGLNASEARTEAAIVLEKVNLSEKSDSLVHTLSGGMKRRLSLANAIIGKTKLLILDEPTSGLDPESRRDVWDVLLKLRSNHTILLTTHFMEEADVLADWVAIMEEGQLVAFGSPLHLKHVYGKGYTLKLLKKSNFDEETVLKKVQHNIPGAVMRDSVREVFAITLPYDAFPEYSALLKELEDAQQELGIETIDIANATLEEVFLSGISAIAEKSLPAVWLRAEKIERAHGVVVLNWATNLMSGNQPWNWEAVQSNLRSSIDGVQLQVREGGSLVDVLREQIEQDYTGYCDRTVVAIECNVTDNDMHMTVLYNNNLVHSTGIAESVATTLLLRLDAGEPDAIVQVQNIPSTRKQLINIQTPFFFTEFISIAFMFYVLLFLLVPVQEHLTSFRRLQNINRYKYWGVTYIFDMFVHLTVCIAVILLVHFLDQRKAFSDSSKVHIFFILLLYGMLAIVAIYIISQCVESTNTAITIMSYLMIVGVGGVFLLSNGYDDIKNNSIPAGIMHIIPEFALKHSMRVVYENQKLVLYEQMSNQQDHRQHKHAFASDRISPRTFYLWAVPVWVMLVFILNEVVDNISRREKVKMSRATAEEKLRKAYLHMRWTIFRDGSSIQQQQLNPTYEHDETDSPSAHCVDVDQEKNLVKNLLSRDKNEDDNQDEYAIVVNDLKKIYTNHEAVKSVSFAVKKSECFGLLGMNGAGKTTLFQMLSANLPTSQGEIYLQQCEVHKADEVEYRRQYGYCPQLDVLLDFMTVYEVIKYIAEVQGMSTSENSIMNWLAMMDIVQYKDHALRECSGGTKRKVNTIMALLGRPSVVLLDEPTTGVDPKSRYFLWKTIKKMQQDDQTILLTSHSMDECEELCNRLSIMADGVLKCVGTIPQLKKRHGLGYTLWLKLHTTYGVHQKLIRDVTTLFNASLQEEHEGLLKFLVDQSFKLSEMFKTLHELQDKWNEQIIHASITESSLEDIFLKFRPKFKQQVST
uniref:ABC transporter domain-containing protein n=1 Tax=Anopheles farauti TaxID=69004 RepID=A0A182QTM8_9DIPT